jgi:lipoate-protein ligase A
MATDEALLSCARTGQAALRFYGWAQPTLSLGYFQSAKILFDDALLTELPFVRRQTGGSALVHHFEVTYCLCLPAGPWQRGQPWPQRMHRVIAAALAEFGVVAKLHHPNAAATFEGPLCFHHLTACDLLVQGRKIGGSAQRKHRGSLLQHGGILLVQSPHAPSLPGILELTGRVVRPSDLTQALATAFALESGGNLEESPFSEGELKAAADLVTTKYTAAAWNLKR